MALDPARAALRRLVAGVALIVASLNVVFRDVEHILAAALLPWFFLTPILWASPTCRPSVHSHHERCSNVLALGELRRPADLRGARHALARRTRRAPPTSIYLAVAAVVALALGAYVFGRVDDRIAIEL